MVAQRAAGVVPPHQQLLLALGRPQGGQVLRLRLRQLRVARLGNPHLRDHRLLPQPGPDLRQLLRPEDAVLLLLALADDLQALEVQDGLLLVVEEALVVGVAEGDQLGEVELLLGEADPGEVHPEPALVVVVELGLDRLDGEVDVEDHLGVGVDRLLLVVQQDHLVGVLLLLLGVLDLEGRLLLLLLAVLLLLSSRLSRVCTYCCVHS